MAKKGTTGGPRTQRTTTEEIDRRKRHISRAEKERIWQRRVLLVTGVLIALSVIVLIIAIINQEVIQPRQPITTVNDVEIKTNDFQDRVRLTRWLTANQIREAYFFLGGDVNTLQQYVGQQISDLQRPVIIGSQVLEEMEEEILLEQGARALGVEVDPAQIDREIEEFMGDRVGLAHPDHPTPTATTEPTAAPTRLVPTSTPLPTVTPIPTIPPTPVEGEDEEPADDEEPAPEPTTEPTVTPTLEPDAMIATIEREQDRWFDDATDSADVDRDVIRDLFYYDALRVAVRDHLAQDVPTEELQVNARHMLFSFTPDAQTQGVIEPTEEEKAAARERAEAAMDALQDGEPFADLAREVSDDTGSAARGGELDWSSPDGYVDAFKEAVLNGEIGAILGPVESEFGYHIIQVNGREIRPLTPSTLRDRQNQALNDWLDGLRADANIDRRDDWIDRIPEDPTYNELLGDILPIQ